MRPSDMSRLVIPLLALAALCGCGTASTSTAAPVTAGQPPAPTSPAVPLATSAQSMTSATLVYVGPAGANQVRVTKPVDGAAMDRLTADIAELKPSAGQMRCTLDNGESSTLTVAEGGHTTVYVVPGEPCRGVRVTADGVARPGLGGSMALIGDLRTIADGGKATR